MYIRSYIKYFVCIYPVCVLINTRYGKYVICYGIYIILKYIMRHSAAVIVCRK